MNNNKKVEEIKKEQPKELCVEYAIDGNQIKLTPSIVQNYIVGSQAKITPVEFKFFTELCKVRKLNPFLNEAYLIKYSENNPAQLVVGKDVILKRAILNPQYNGMESGIIVYDETTGVLTERKGTFKLKNEELVGGWAKVYIKNREYPSYVSVSFEEVAQRKKDGSLNSNWSTKPATMVEKVAKVRALREAFVDDLSGMYDNDEMPTYQEELPIVHGSDKIELEQQDIETIENENEVKEVEEVQLSEI